MLSWVLLSRFCPSVFFYLSTIVPCVWTLELDRLSDRIDMLEAYERGLNRTKIVNNMQDVVGDTIFKNVSLWSF